MSPPPLRCKPTRTTTGRRTTPRKTETFVKDIVSISGQKFEDANGNGLRDPGELGLNGFTIELVDPTTNGVLMTTMTAPIDLNGDRTLDPQTEYGRYAFDFLVAGAYEVRERVAAGFPQTFPSGGAASTAARKRDDRGRRGQPRQLPRLDQRRWPLCRV